MTSAATAPLPSLEPRSPVTGELLGSVARSTPQDVDRAAEVAEHAFESSGWARDARLRSAVLAEWAARLEAGAGEVARLLVLETGKLLAECELEVRASVEALRVNAGLAAHIGGRAGLLPDGSTAHLERQPIGVTAFITPWNWPLLLLTRDLGPALAAGVTALVKPADATPLSTVELVGLARAAGMPDGIVQVLQGGAGIGAALVAHRRVRAVAFTGSTAVGAQIMAAGAPTLKRLLLELGGKGCNVVFADADLDAVVPTLLRTAFVSAGQMCMATTRILVERGRYRELLERVVSEVESMRVGDPFDAASSMGPLFSHARRDAVERYIEFARSSARVAVGGDPFDIGAAAYLTPAVVTDIDVASPLVQEEIFGPVVTVEPFSGADEAVALANAQPYGLAAGVWTADVGRAWKVARGIDAGSVWVNGYMRSFPEMPSGGFKQSGLGRTRGIEGLEQFTEIKHINWSA